LPHLIKVTNVAPGMVETEFSVVRFKGDQARADQAYQGLQPLTGPDIADVILYVANTPPHVTINDVVVMPTAQAAATLVQRG
jgi:NADP-dependent 3-hydroxy acid dehydrogenase YdfG